jgi:ATP-dependent RNA helicase DDX3X
VDKEEDVFREIHHTGINFSKYDNIPVSVTGSEVPECCNTFDDAKFHHTIMDNVLRAKYTVPTPVQKHSFAIVGAGRDLMACAQTGSGKTAAFLFPTINRLLKDSCYARPSRGRQTPEALIVAPTRELAMQIHAEAVKFCFRTGLRSVVCYGGSPIQHQFRELETGCNILVGTPGRLIDLVDRGKISFASIKFLILDEADRMLDMGFEKDIRQIVEGRDMNTRRQTLMFSATFPKEIRQLASDFLYEYLFLKVGRVGSTTESITQHIKHLKSFDKQGEVIKEIKTTPGKTLIFAETKRDTDSLARYLFSQGFQATGIHGDRSQREREAALRSFKAGKIQLLVATDVAARGLDIDDVTHVINYDLPANIDSYVHRIGRTGRAGNLGKATSFFTDENKGLARQLVKVLRESNQIVPDWLDRFALEGKAGKGGAMRRGGYGGGARYNPYGGGNAARSTTSYW